MLNTGEQLQVLLFRPILSWLRKMSRRKLGSGPALLPKPLGIRANCLSSLVYNRTGFNQLFLQASLGTKWMM
jgi:hypothetical protein